MRSEPSEKSFEKGLEALERREFVEALVYFEASMQLVQRASAAPPMKYLSYYGLCLAMATGRLSEAMEICEEAVEAEFYNPDLYLNLGRVYLKAGDRSKAFGAMVGGLQLNPRHPGLIRAIRRLGLRRRPTVRFLARTHLVNRLLGKLLAGQAARPAKGFRSRSPSARRSHQPSR